MSYSMHVRCVNKGKISRKRRVEGVAAICHSLSLSFKLKMEFVLDSRDLLRIPHGAGPPSANRERERGRETRNEPELYEDF